MAEAVSEIRRLLDQHPWAGTTPRLSLLGFDVVMRASDADVTALLSDLYAPLAGAGDAEHVLTMTSTAAGSAARRPRWDVHLDGTRLIRSEAPSIAFQHLLFEANRQAIDHTHDLVLVHASAAALDGTAIVMPGPMGAGKSTLVAGLVQRGLGYLTDEIVALDPGTGLVQPYPKYLSLGPTLAHLVPERPAAMRAIVGDQRLVPAAAIRPGASGGPTLPRIVVAPRYERGAATRVEPLRPAEALSALAQHAFHMDRDGPRSMATLTALVERSSCYSMVSGDVDEGCDALLALFDEARTPVGS